MDSKVVNQGIKGHIWPRLRACGFGTFSSRSAWRHRSDRIEVVNFQSFNAYNAGVIGCTTFSFAVNLGCYLLAIPPQFEPSRIKEKKGHLMPEEYTCHFRGQLSPSIPQPKLLAKNIWFIDETGSNLALSFEDVWIALGGSGLSWFEQFDSPAQILRILQHEAQQQGRLWGFGNNPSPRRHYFIGYVALNLKDGGLAKDHLQRALSSGRFSSVEGRLAKDIERAAK